jgi:O-antigen ligase
MAIFSFQFVNPSKFYLVEVLKGYEIRDVYFMGGRLLRYGIHLSNIFLVLTFIFGVLEGVKRKSREFSFFSKDKVLGFVLPAISFLLFGLGVSILRSPFAFLSSVWTIQYAQLFLVAAASIYFYLYHSPKFNLLFSVVCLSIFLQFFLSAVQFVKQAPVGIPIEATETIHLPQALDMPSFYRAVGTFGVSIELVLVTMINFAIILPWALENKKPIYLGALVASLIVLILAQGRTGYIGLLIILLVALKAYARRIKEILFGPLRKMFVLLLIGLSLLSFVFVPRILLSLNSGYEGGGLPLRQKMIEEGIEALFLSPLLGYGAGMNEFTLHSLFPDGVMNVFPLPVLEGHLQFLLEFGILGAFIAAVPFYLTTRKIVNAWSKDKRYYKRHKSFVISFLLGIFLVNLHYFFQSHDGVIEFQYLGLLLGIGMIAAYSKSWYKGAENERVEASS